MTTIQLEQSLLAMVRSLPQEQQQAILSFAHNLYQQSNVTPLSEETSASNPIVRSDAADLPIIASELQVVDGILIAQPDQDPMTTEDLLKAINDMREDRINQLMQW